MKKMVELQDVRDALKILVFCKPPWYRFLLRKRYWRDRKELEKILLGGR